MLPQPAGDNSYLISYLNNERGISKAVIELFLKENLIYESRHYHNIVFKGNDKNGVTRFASMRGVFDKQGKPKLTEKEKPSLKAGSGAVIKLEACSICGTDIRTYRFGSNKIPDGRILGHEIVGRIAQIKEKYSNEFPVGTYVSMRLP